MITGNVENIWSRIAKSVAMLGCDTDAQRLAALGGVRRLLEAQGLDYRDVADRLCRPGQRGDNAACASKASFGDLARAARDLDRGQLTLKERAFVIDMVAKGFAYRPTPRQAQWLDDILIRLRGRAAA